MTEEAADKLAELEEMVEAYEEAADKLAELTGDTAEAHLWSNDFNKCIGAIRGIRNETKKTLKRLSTRTRKPITS